MNMRHNEFVDLVQQRANLENRTDAERITEVTLATLGERIYRSARDDVAAQLPAGLKEYLQQRARPEVTPEHVDRFSLEEFYSRVSARAGVGYPDAVELARAVFQTLREAISAGEWQDLQEELPAEYDELLSA
jgi:uncharacterized protein (DUF2267 family)